MHAHEDAHQRPRLLTPPFVLLMLANFMLSIAGGLMVHLPGFLAQLGAGEAAIGRVLALLALSAALLTPLVGRVMDRRGRRIVIRTGAVITLLGSSAYLQITSVGAALYAVRVVEGVGATMLYTAMFTYASDLVPAVRRTEGLALYGASGLVTLGISSELGDLILGASTYRALFATAVAFCAIGTVLCWKLPSPPHAQRAQDSPPGGLRMLGQRDLQPIWAAALAFFSCMAGMLAFLKTFVLHTQHGSVGAFFGAYALCATALRLFFGSLPDRVGPRRMVLPALGGYVLGLATLALGSGDVALLCAGVLCGMCHGYTFPVLLSLVITRSPAELRGTATATFTTFDWAAHVLTPPLLGLLIERAGYGVGFGALSALATAGIVAFYALDTAAAR
jgi:MFS family permease